MWRVIAEIVLKLYLVVGEISVLALSINKARDYSFYGESDVNVLKFLLVFVLGNVFLFVSATSLGMIIDAIKHLESIDSNSKELLRVIKEVNRVKPDGATNSKMNLSEIANTSSTGEWRCKSCDAVNDAYTVMCKKCGQHK